MNLNNDNGETDIEITYMKMLYGNGYGISTYCCPDIIQQVIID